MHYRFFMLFNKKKAKNEGEAREFAFNKMTRKISSYGDWFVIGGRWSGILTKAYIGKRKLKAFEKEFEKKYGWYTNSEFSDEIRIKQVKNLFRKHFPQYDGIIPYWRNTYNSDGFSDDAKIVDKVIYDSLLKEYEGEINNENFLDIEGDKLSKDVIGTKWIVVIDYHM